MKIAIFFVVLVLLGWGGLNIGKLYFDHKTIENEVGVIAEDAANSKQGDPKEKIVTLLTNYQAEFKPESIAVEPSADGRAISIRGSYTRKASLGITEIPFSFEINVQRSVAKVLQNVQDSVEQSNQVQGELYKKAIQNATGKQGEETVP